MKLTAFQDIFLLDVLTPTSSMHNYNTRFASKLNFLEQEYTPIYLCKKKCLLNFLVQNLGNCGTCWSQMSIPSLRKNGNTTLSLNQSILITLIFYV